MWIDELKENVIDLSLKRMRKFIKEHGKLPYKIIHVGGTNGKGSVSHFIYSILKQRHKVGIYTSPHLERVNERIIVDGEMISDEDIEKYTWLKKYNFTYFEALTAIALMHFLEKEVEYAVIEVGLGGRLDATNVVDAIVTIITNVSLEHENLLGKSIEEIAREKAGIIKSAPVITAAKGKALEIIEEEARKKGVDIYVVGRDVRWEKLGKNEFLIESGERYKVKSPLYGSFQGENIALAIKACELLGMKREDIIEGIKNAKLHGRMEIVGNYILDGCHNPAAIAAFSSSIGEFGKEFTFIFGAMKDKNVEEMVKKLPDAGVYIATKVDNERAMSPRQIAEIGRHYGKNFIVTENVKEAIEVADKISQGMICIIGSLYVVGEARKILREKGLL